MTQPVSVPLTVFEQLTPQQQLEHLHSVAERALACWGLRSGAGLTLLSLSENATFRVSRAGHNEPLIMRVHRTGYHSREAIRTELAWMAALQQQAGVQTPQALAGSNGEMIQSVKTPNLEEERFVVMFHLIPGVAPDEAELIAPFKRLGAVTARMHNHARGWTRPAYFERLIWDYDGCLGQRKHWGDWRDGPGLDQAGKALLEQVDELLHTRLLRYGMGPQRFGLIHADLRLANLLESDGDTRVIDFDDAGLGWFLYDLAGAVSFIETRADLPQLIDAWVAGYQTQGQLSAADIAEIPTFIMLRRLTLLAWVASHANTELAQSQGEAFTAGTVELGRKYLQHMRVETAEAIQCAMLTDTLYG